MPAVSKAQQKFMGMVHSAQKGEMKPTGAVKKAAKSMTKKAATDFASTKHKGLPGHVKESVEKGESIVFSYVLRPTSHDQDPGELVVRTHVVDFAKNHPEFYNIYGYYLDGNEADKVAIDLVKDLHDKANMLEEKKVKVTDALQKKIDQLQKEVDHKLKEAKKDPAKAQSHQDMAKALLEKIKTLRDKHTMVESSKKPLKGNQKKLDVNKNGKIDKEDFKLLRK